jgi:hypothetical protein
LKFSVLDDSEAHLYTILFVHTQESFSVEYYALKESIFKFESLLHQVWIFNEL